MRSYELAERAGWARLSELIRPHGVLPPRFFADPAAYACELADAVGADAALAAR